MLRLILLLAVPTAILFILLLIIRVVAYWVGVS